MSQPPPLKSLSKESLSLLKSISTANPGPLELSDHLYSLLRAGSVLTDGTFTTLALHAGLSVPALDLRPFTALESFTANASSWKQKFSRLVLGEHTRLTKLQVSGHGLASIDLSGCTALVELDVSYNALTTLELPPSAPLVALNASDNQLASIDLSRHRSLLRLGLMDNQLTRLDLADFDRLTRVLCTGNPLTHVGLPKRAPVELLSLSRCPIGALDVSAFPLLATLFCDACALATLDVSTNAKLSQLSCDENKLTALDLSKNAALTSLSAMANPLKALDVRGLMLLAKLEVDAGVSVLCDERQKRAIPALRKAFGIKANAKLADKDLWELDLLASAHNWDDGVKKLLAVVQHPRCDLGTALKIYWLAQPEELAEFPTAKGAPKDERAAVELVRAIEARVARKDFATSKIRFEGKSTDDARIPRAMCKRLEPKPD